LERYTAAGHQSTISGRQPVVGDADAIVASRPACADAMPLEQEVPAMLDGAAA
jgi:hypothetical protein